MEYQVVFDVNQLDWEWWIFVGPLLCIFTIIAITGVVQLQRKRSRSIPTTFTTTKVIIGWIVVLLITGVSVLHTLTRRQYRWLLATHQTAVVEGLIERFVPQPPSGKGYEEFTVQGVHFAYSSDDLSTGGYNRISKHGVPIGLGTFVRVHYLPGSVSDDPADENIILKLEVRR